MPHELALDARQTAAGARNVIQTLHTGGWNGVTLPDVGPDERREHAHAAPEDGSKDGSDDVQPRLVVRALAKSEILFVVGAVKVHVGPRAWRDVVVYNEAAEGTAPEDACNDKARVFERADRSG